MIRAEVERVGTPALGEEEIGVDIAPRVGIEGAVEVLEEIGVGEILDLRLEVETEDIGLVVMTVDPPLPLGVLLVVDGVEVEQPGAVLDRRPPELVADPIEAVGELIDYEGGVPTTLGGGGDGQADVGTETIGVTEARHQEAGRSFPLDRPDHIGQIKDRDTLNLDGRAGELAVALHLEQGFFEVKAPRGMTGVVLTGREDRLVDPVASLIELFDGFAGEGVHRRHVTRRVQEQPGLRSQVVVQLVGREPARSLIDHHVSLSHQIHGLPVVQDLVTGEGHVLVVDLDVAGPQADLLLFLAVLPLALLNIRNIRRRYGRITST